MSTLWGLFEQAMECSDTAIYIADYETNELLYINKAARDILKVADTIPQGETCFHYLMRRDSPCQFCHKVLLTEDQFAEKNITFPFNGKRYRIRSKVVFWEQKPGSGEKRKAHVHFIDETNNVLSEQSFQTMLEHIPGAMVVFEAHEGMLWLRYISEGCKAITGLTPEETYARSSLDPLADAHPDSRTFFQKNEAKDIASGRKLSYKYQLICKDGSYKWVNLRLSPVYTGGELFYYGVLRDIDADETELIERENAYEQVVTQMKTHADPNLIAKARYDLSRNQIKYYERGAERSLDLAGKETYDQALELMERTATTSVQGEQIRTKLNRARLLQDFASGRSGDLIEYQRVLENGSFFWCQLKYSMIENPDDGHVIFLVYTYDITERVLEENMIRKLGATQYDVLGLIDVKTHRFESKNIKGVNSIAGASRYLVQGSFEEVVHRQILKTVLEDERRELEERLSLEVILKKLERHETYSMAFTAYRKDQSSRRKQMNFCYLDDSHATLFYYCTDITEMYDREQEQLKRTEEALESARQANKSRTDFFSRMSHDMRTPLNGILGSVYLANASEEHSPQMAEYLHDIQFSGEFLLNLVNDVLDMSKIESGRMELCPEVYTYSEFIRNMTKMIEPLCREKHITLNMNPLKEDNAIYVDILRFQQIFFNIFSNAVKYTPEGGTIDHFTEITPIDERHIDCKCHIIDNGIGMSEEFQKHLFDPYARENQTVSQSQGTGLGMSIANHLAMLMGGGLIVKSELGKGTEVIIHTVLELTAMPEEKTGMEEPGNKLWKEKEVLSGTHVLLCEDHPLNAKIALRMLKRWGVEAELAENGEVGVKRFADSKPGSFDVILMDIRMPVMDGLEAARRIRSLERPDAAEVPIVAMTANAYESDITHSLEAGMNAHLAKPVDPEKLFEMIEEMTKDNHHNRIVK